MIRYISPQVEQTKLYLASINGIEIQICTNTDDILQNITDKNCYCSIEKSQLNKSVFTIYLLKSDSVKEEYTVREDKAKVFEEIVDKSFEYPNLEYCFGNWRVVFNKYPNHSIIVTDVNSCVIMASRIEVLTFYLKMQIKEIIVKQLKDCALHASAIASKNKSFVFVGPSNSGKSTLAYNLTHYGWELVNDDLIFVKNKKGKFVVSGADINPCIRGVAIPYLLNSRDFLENQEKYLNSYHNCYYLKKMGIEQKETTLTAIFVLTFDKKKHVPPKLIKSISQRRKILKSFVRSDMEESSYFKLCDIPMYELNVENPVEEINCFLKKIS